MHEKLRTSPSKPKARKAAGGLLALTLAVGCGNQPSNADLLDDPNIPNERETHRVVLSCTDYDISNAIGSTYAITPKVEDVTGDIKSPHLFTTLYYEDVQGNVHLLVKQGLQQMEFNNAMAVQAPIIEIADLSTLENPPASPEAVTPEHLIDPGLPIGALALCPELKKDEDENIVRVPTVKELQEQQQ